jgi:hypothetical protein
LCIVGQLFLLFAYYPAYLQSVTRVEKNFDQISVQWRYSPLLAQYRMSAENLLTSDQGRQDTESDTAEARFKTRGLNHFFFVWLRERYTDKLAWLSWAIAVLAFGAGYGLFSGYRSQAGKNESLFPSDSRR